MRNSGQPTARDIQTGDRSAPHKEILCSGLGFPRRGSDDIFAPRNGPGVGRRGSGMTGNDGTYDPDTVAYLDGVVDEVWNSLAPANQLLIPRTEVARLVMLLVEAGVERKELVEKTKESLISGTDALLDL